MDVTDDKIVERIVQEVLRRIGSKFERGLIIIPRFRSELAQAFFQLSNSDSAYRIFDLALPQEIPSTYIRALADHGLQIDKQFTDPDSVEFTSYERVYVFDLHPALIREISDIRPYSQAGTLVIDAIEAHKTIVVMTCAIEAKSACKVSPFYKSLTEDIAKLKAWGVNFSNGHSQIAHVPGKLITASKLHGYENQVIDVDVGAIFTALAREKMTKDDIRVVE